MGKKLSPEEVFELNRQLYGINPWIGTFVRYVFWLTGLGFLVAGLVCYALVFSDFGNMQSTFKIGGDYGEVCVTGIGFLLVFTVAFTWLFHFVAVRVIGIASLVGFLFLKALLGCITWFFMPCGYVFLIGGGIAFFIVGALWRFGSAFYTYNFAFFAAGFLGVGLNMLGLIMFGEPWALGIVGTVYLIGTAFHMSLFFAYQGVRIRVLMLKDETEEDRSKWLALVYAMTCVFLMITSVGAYLWYFFRTTRREYLLWILHDLTLPEDEP